MIQIFCSWIFLVLYWTLVRMWLQENIPNNSNLVIWFAATLFLSKNWIICKHTTQTNHISVLHSTSCFWFLHKLFLNVQEARAQKHLILVHSKSLTKNVTSNKWSPIIPPQIFGETLLENDYQYSVRFIRINKDSYLSSSNLPLLNSSTLRTCKILPEIPALLLKLTVSHRLS